MKNLLISPSLLVYTTADYRDQRAKSNSWHKIPILPAVCAAEHYGMYFCSYLEFLTTSWRIHCCRTAYHNNLIAVPMGHNNLTVIPNNLAVAAILNSPLPISQCRLLNLFLILKCGNRGQHRPLE